ncbi:hypothetical protein HK098_004613 [Nowakowskiella sp. JEL0407]|nr:hypothetical protein HK098_004613 [Nowakowskiella sp. JEL0407]
MQISPNKDYLSEISSFSDANSLLNLINSIQTNQQTSQTHNDNQLQRLRSRKPSSQNDTFDSEWLVNPSLQWSGQDRLSISLDMLSEAMGPDISASETVSNDVLPSPFIFSAPSDSVSDFFTPESLLFNEFSSTDFPSASMSWNWLESPLISDTSNSTLLNNINLESYSNINSIDPFIDMASKELGLTPETTFIPTPQMPTTDLDAMIANLDPELLATLFPSPEQTPASSVSTFVNPDRLFSNTFQDESNLMLDPSGFDLFPSLDDVTASSPTLSTTTVTPMLPLLDSISPLIPQVDPVVSSIHQLVQQSDPTNNVSPAQIAAFMVALSKFSALIPQAEPVVPATAGGPIRVDTRKPRRKTKMYGCDHPGCDKEFSRQFNLKAHKKTHDPDRDRPFACEVCDKRFLRNHDLLRHEPVHTKAKNFECELCKKRFTRKDAKDRHLVQGKCNNCDGTKNIWSSPNCIPCNKYSGASYGTDAFGVYGCISPYKCSQGGSWSVKDNKCSCLPSTPYWTGSACIACDGTKNIWSSPNCIQCSKYKGAYFGTDVFGVYGCISPYTCASGGAWSVASNKCECKTSTPFWNENSGACVACDGTKNIWSAPNCIPCAKYSGAYYGNDAFGTYGCISSYKCPTGKTWSVKDNKCDCSPSTPVWTGSVCVACPSNTPVWNGSKCVASSKSTITLSNTSSGSKPTTSSGSSSKASSTITISYNTIPNQSASPTNNNVSPIPAGSPVSLTTLVTNSVGSPTIVATVVYSPVTSPPFGSPVTLTTVVTNSLGSPVVVPTVVYSPIANPSVSPVISPPTNPAGSPVTQTIVVTNSVGSPVVVPTVVLSPIPGVSPNASPSSSPQPSGGGIGGGGVIPVSPVPSPETSPNSESEEQSSCGILPYIIQFQPGSNAATQIDALKAKFADFDFRYSIDIDSTTKIHIAYISASTAAAVKQDTSVLSIKMDTCTGYDDIQSSAPQHLGSISSAKFAKIVSSKISDNYYFNGQGGGNARVYVIDGGIDNVMKGFLENNIVAVYQTVLTKTWQYSAFVMQGETFVPQTDHTYDDRFRRGHGTKVAAIVNHPFLGVAKNAEVYTLQTGAPESDIWNAIRFAIADNANGKKKIINISKNWVPTAEMDAFLREAYDNGILVVTSAGNKGINACAPSGAPEYRISEGFYSKIGIPIDDEKYPLVTVNLKPDGDLYSGSNFGPCANMAAIGVFPDNVFSIPRTMGDSIGTSYAAPQVSGAAAVLWTAYPTLTVSALKAILKSSKSVQLSNYMAGNLIPFTVGVPYWNRCLVNWIRKYVPRQAVATATDDEESCERTTTTTTTGTSTSTPTKKPDNPENKPWNVGDPCPVGFLCYPHFPPFIWIIGGGMACPAGFLCYLPFPDLPPIPEIPWPWADGFTCPVGFLCTDGEIPIPDVEWPWGNEPCPKGYTCVDGQVPIPNKKTPTLTAVVSPTASPDANPSPTGNGSGSSGGVIGVPFTVEDKNFEIRWVRDKSKCIDAGGNTDGSSIQLNNCDGGANQSFKFSNSQIVNVKSNLCISIFTNSLTDYGIQMKNCDGAETQLWEVRGVLAHGVIVRKNLSPAVITYSDQSQFFITLFDVVLNDENSSSLWDIVHGCEGVLDACKETFKTCYARCSSSCTPGPGYESCLNNNCQIADMYGCNAAQISCSNSFKSQCAKL